MELLFIWLTLCVVSSEDDLFSEHEWSMVFSEVSESVR